MTSEADPVPVDDDAGNTDETYAGSGDQPCASPENSRWSRLPTFWGAAGALLIVLLALIPIMSNGHVAAPDDGVYAAQASLLAEGTWSQPRPAAQIDADGLNSAVGPDLVYRDRQVPYLKHPLFPTALSALYRIGGFNGLLVFSVLGAWLAAVAAGLIARRLDPRYGLVALGITAVGSPLVFDAYIVSAHGMGAAMCGLVALGAAQVIDGRRWNGLLLALPCAAIAVGLRTEASIVMLAFTLVVAALAIHPTQRPRLDRRAIVLALSVLAVSGSAYLLDAWWSRHIKATVGAVDQPLIRTLSTDRDVLASTWISLLRPWYGNGQDAQPALVLGVVAILLAAVALKFISGRWLLPVALMVLGAACLSYQVLENATLVSGFIAAFPLGIGGLILLRWIDLGRPIIARQLGVSIVAVVGIAISSYGVGGAIEWGGRFYHLLIPFLAPCAVLGLNHARAALPRRPGRVAAIAAAVATVSLSLIGLGYLRGAREVSQQTVTAARSFTLQHSRTRDGSTRQKPLLIVGNLRGDGTSRMFWETSPDMDVISAIGIGDLFTVINRARNHGYPSVVVVTNISPTSLVIVGDKRLQDTGWELGDLRAISGTPFGLVEYGPAHSISEG